MKKLFFIGVLAIVGTFALLLVGEIAVRVRYAVYHKDPAWLVMGILHTKARVAPRPAVPTIAQKDRMVIWSDCSQRDVEYRRNSAGGRGTEWPVDKPPGTVRILAIGESVTWGAGNPENRTWPAVLEQRLKSAYGLDAEVLNFGKPGERLPGIVALLPAVLDKYHPDLVIHYGGFNQTWREAEVPQALSFLNYRSMLYTYIYEKVYFRAEASAMRRLPDTRAFEQDFRRLAEMTRQRGASLVVVDQATAAGAPDGPRSTCASKWGEEKSLQGCLDALMAHLESRFTPVQWTRMYKTDVLQRVLADAAASVGAFVIDPRGAVVERNASHPLFCDEAHLTDDGEAALADAIVGPLAGYIKAAKLRTPGS